MSDAQATPRVDDLREHQATLRVATGVRLSRDLSEVYDLASDLERALAAATERAEELAADGHELKQDVAELIHRAADAQRARLKAESRLAALEAVLRAVREQAEGGVFVEHECPAMFACAAIIAELKTALPDASKGERK